MDVFWSRVRGRLQAKERSQAWLARQLGVKRQLISLWVYDRQPFPAARRAQIAALLDINDDEEVAA